MPMVSIVYLLICGPPLTLMTDRYKMAGQWYGLPKLFPKSENLGYEIVKNDDTLIQFKNKQVGPVFVS